jgi:hypothetical protein
MWEYAVVVLDVGAIYVSLAGEVGFVFSSERLQAACGAWQPRVRVNNRRAETAKRVKRPTQPLRDEHTCNVHNHWHHIYWTNVSNTPYFGEIGCNSIHRNSLRYLVGWTLVYYYVRIQRRLQLPFLYPSFIRPSPRAPRAILLLINAPIVSRTYSSPSSAASAPQPPALFYPIWTRPVSPPR